MYFCLYPYLSFTNMIVTECRICFDEFPISNVTSRCCIQSICTSCDQKWFDMHINRIVTCMICKHELQTIKNAPKFLFKLDFSSFSNALSTMRILFTTYPCKNCGVRYSKVDGCNTITCSNCLTTQYHFGLVERVLSWSKQSLLYLFQTIGYSIVMSVLFIYVFFSCLYGSIFIFIQFLQTLMMICKFPFTYITTVSRIFIK